MLLFLGSLLFSVQSLWARHFLPNRTKISKSLPSFVEKDHRPKSLRAHHKKPKPPEYPPELFEHLTTHEKYYLQADLPGGKFSQKQIAAMSHLMRCHHTGKEKKIHPLLISMLYRIARHYNNAKIYIIAGYRAPEIARAKGNPRSPHQKGIASDIRVLGVSNEDLRDYLRTTHDLIGVGYYPNSGFVHIDVERKYAAYWIDTSAPGQQARYIRPNARGRKLPQSLSLISKNKLLTKRKSKRSVTLVS